jgi:hypothetical protein
MSQAVWVGAVGWYRHDLQLTLWGASVHAVQFRASLSDRAGLVGGLSAGVPHTLADKLGPPDKLDRPDMAQLHCHRQHALQWGPRLRHNSLLAFAAQLFQCMCIALPD